MENPEIAQILRSPSAQTQIRNPEKEECDELDEIAPKSRMSMITETHNDVFFFHLKFIIPPSLLYNKQITKTSPDLNLLMNSLFYEHENEKTCQDEENSPSVS